MLVSLVLGCHGTKMVVFFKEKRKMMDVVEVFFLVEERGVRNCHV